MTILEFWGDDGSSSAMVWSDENRRVRPERTAERELWGGRVAGPAQPAGGRQSA
ncbi:hypothetical protein EV382_1900 [Micromonospora violae]|uniref:Uncharacterized protein n=1 Tax=Micromonospora violae TaxID=1278207 RepID=A0A4Q7UEJ5_9ACTN|nr:hypothetical protein EV382_1900 [Micromonospora violae]